MQVLLRHISGNYIDIQEKESDYIDHGSPTLPQIIVWTDPLCNKGGGREERLQFLYRCSLNGINQECLKFVGVIRKFPFSRNNETVKYEFQLFLFTTENHEVLYRGDYMA